MAIVENISSEIGDIIRIKTDIPIIGIVSISHFIDDTLNETIDRYFDKYFRYSIDGGMNFTEWKDLTVINIQEISITKKSQFVIDYKYVDSGTNPNGTLVFNNLELNGSYQEVPYPIYRRNFFNIFFDINDVKVLNWAVNVLEKIYSKGIVPEYIYRKDDEINPIESDIDYITFFNSITHLFAIIVNYGRIWEEISKDNLLLKTFLDNKKLYYSIDESIINIKYLFDNYRKEFENRGTNAIFYKSIDENIPNGELLRLISFKNNDEFIFSLLENNITGWCMGFSSPMYNSTKFSENMIIGYEKYNGFKTTDSYPQTSNNILSINESPNYLLIDSGSSQTNNGIKLSNFNIENVILINPNNNYELLLEIEILEEVNLSGNITMGCDFFDKNEQLLTGFNLKSKTQSNNFFDNFQLYSYNERYFISAILYNFNTDENIGDLFEMKLDIGVGGQLKIPENTLYISPYFYINSSINDTNQIKIYNFKVRLANFNFTQGIFQLKKIIYMEYKNNSLYKNEKIVDIISSNLIPINTNLIEKDNG